MCWFGQHNDAIDLESCQYEHGGFVVGSEMSGGVHHIFVDNCTFAGTDIGLRFKTMRGRGDGIQN
jgi:DNA sulfur modification protein DndE